MGRLRITYREFWDVPRIFVTKWRGRLFLFSCPFDDALDDYPDHYSVYELPVTLEKSLRSMTWVGLDARGKYLRQIPIKDVSFSERRLQELLGIHLLGVTSIDDRVFRVLGLE